MSSINFRILIFALFFSFFCYSQKNLPNLILIKADGSEVNLNKLSDESIIILSFWATWCVPCINELNAYNSMLADLKQNYNTQFIAISIDDSRTISRVTPMKNGNNWQFDIVLDVNQKIKNKLNIIDIPHSILIYKNKIVYEHTGYSSGDEMIFIEKINTIK